MSVIYEDELRQTDFDTKYYLDFILGNVTSKEEYEIRLKELKEEKSKHD